MTKYVIHSGGIRASDDKGAKFFAEIVSGLGPNPKILLCLFAQPREDWEAKFVEYRDGFSQHKINGVNPTFKLAFPNKFVDQIKQSDAIYIHGGDDHLVQYWLKQYDLPEIWEGKVVATNSAGSDAIVSSFWTCDWRMCMDGLGILPIKFIPHFRSTAYGASDPRGPIDWDKAYEELKDYDDKGLPIHKPKEGEFIVIEA